MSMSVPSSHPLLETKELFDSPTSTPKTFGFTIADELLKELNDVSDDIQRLPKIRERIHVHLKNAFKLEDPNLYAHILKGLVDFCIFAHKNNKFPNIVSIIGLEDQEEIQDIFRLLDDGQIGAFTYGLINDDTLEKFAEDLDKNKATLLPFKKKLYNLFEGQKISCQPIDVVQDLKLSKDQFIERYKNIQFQIGYYLDYLLQQNDPLKYAEIVYHLVLKMVEWQNDSKIMYIHNFMDIGYNSIDAFNIVYDEKNIPMVCCFFSIILPDEFARSHNIPSSELYAFKVKVYQALEERLNCSLLEKPKVLFENFNLALKSTDHKVLQLAYVAFYFQLVNVYQQSKVEDFADLLLQFCCYVSKKYKEGEVGILTVISASNTTFNAQLKKLLKTDKITLFCYYMMGHIDFEKEIAPNFNIDYKTAITFKHSVLQQIEKLNNTTVFNDSEKSKTVVKPSGGILETGLSSFSVEEELELFELEMHAQLTYVFEGHEPKKYAELVEKIAGLFQDLHERGQTRQLLSILAPKIDLHRSILLLQALETKNRKEALKWIIDKSLRLQIESAHKKNSDYFSEWYQSKGRIVKEENSTKESWLMFQTHLYKIFEISIAVSNLGKILPSDQDCLQYTAPDSSDILDSKALAENLEKVFSAKISMDLEKQAVLIQSMLKKAFSENKPESFIEIFSVLTARLKVAHKNKQYDKMTIFVCRLVEANFVAGTYYRIASIKPFLPKRMEFLFKLLDEESLAEFNFAVIDLLDFKFFSSYNEENLQNIVTFKNIILERLHDSQLPLVKDSKALSELQEKLYSKHPENETSKFLGKKYRLYKNDLILRMQLSGARGRVAGKMLAHSMLESAGLFQKWVSNGDYMLSEKASPNSDQSKIYLKLAQKENQPLLHWMLLNLENFDRYTFKNNLNATESYCLKSLLYNIVADKLDREELLRSPEILTSETEVFLKQKPTVVNLLLLIEEGKALLIDALQSNDTFKFSNFLQVCSEWALKFRNNPEVLARALKLNGKALSEFLVILQQNRTDLAIRFLIEHLAKDPKAWTMFNLSDEDALRFRNLMIENLERQALKKTGSFLSKNPSDLLKDKKVLLEHSHVPKLQCAKMEMWYLLEDAYFKQDAASFSKIITILCDAAIQWYKDDDLRILIQFFELNARETVRVRVGGFSVKSFMQVLIAKDTNGLTKLLVDFYFKNLYLHPLSTGKSYVCMKDNVYKILKIIPLDFHNISSFDMDDVEKELIVKSLRDLANQGVNLEKYQKNIATLAISKSIIDTLIQPKDDDSKAYKDLYRHMKKVWFDHLVAHRFSIMGKHLEGSNSITMACELKDSYNHFKENELCVQTLSQIRSMLPKISDERWQQRSLELGLDVNAIFVKDDTKTLNERLAAKQTIAIPLFLGSEQHDQDQWGHATAAVLFSYQNKWYCILSDRSAVIFNSHRGLMVLEIQNPENLSAASGKFLDSNKEELTLPEIKVVIESLNLKIIKKIDKQMQMSANCGWSSSAIMLLYSLVLAKMVGVYEQADTACTIDQAVSRAIPPTEMFDKAFRGFDQSNTIIRYFKEISEPNVLMLSQIFLKYENRSSAKSIMDTLKLKAFMTDAVRVQGYNELLKSFRRLILGMSGLTLEHSSQIDNKILDEQVKAILDAYLCKKDKKTINSLILDAIEGLKKVYPTFFKDKQVAIGGASAVVSVSGAIVSSGDSKASSDVPSNASIATSAAEPAAALSAGTLTWSYQEGATALPITEPLTPVSVDDSSAEVAKTQGQAPG